MIQRNPRKEQWEQMTRRAIAEAVVHILAREGIERLTMERVAQEAGVAKGTLYSYFHDKQDLLDAAVGMTLEPMRQELAEVLDGPLSPEEKLTELIRRHLGFFDRERDTLRVLVFERQKTFRVRDKARQTRYRQFVERTARLIEQGIADGTFRPVDPMKVAGMLIDANISLVSDRLFGDDTAPLEDDVALVSNLFLRGLSPDPTPPEDTSS